MTATGALSITLTWGAPAAPSAVTMYKVQRSSDGGNTYQTIANFPAPALNANNVVTFVDPTNDGLMAPLATDMTYQYQVIAINPTGSSLPGFTAPIPTPSGVPTSLKAKAVSATEIDLNWQPAAIAPTDYQVWRSLDGKTFALNLTPTPLAGTVTTYQDTTASPDTTYYYEVKGSFDGVTYNPAAITPNDLASATTYPGAPALTYSLSGTAVVLNWSPAVLGAVDYVVQRDSVDAFTNPINIQTLAPTSGTPNLLLTYTDNNTQSGSTYYYRVLAAADTNVPPLESTPSNILTVVLPPTAPASITPTAASMTEIDITWATSQGATSYAIMRGQGSSVNPTGPWVSVATIPSTTAQPYKDQNLTANTSYFYEICAINAGGSSPYTLSTGTVSTLAPLPTPVLIGATAVDGQTVLLQWNALANGAVADTWIIQKKLDTDTTWTTVANTDLTPAGPLPGTATSVDVGNLTPLTHWNFEIIAVKTAIGDSLPSNTMSCSTPAPTGNVLLSGVTASTPATTQNMYFSACPADQLSTGITLQTPITFTGVGATPGVSVAGTSVTLTTDLGTFLPGLGQTAVNPDKSGASKSITGILNAQGQITVTFQGRPSDFRDHVHAGASERVEDADHHRQLRHRYQAINGHRDAS